MPAARTVQAGYPSPHSYEWFVRAELAVARGQSAAAVEAYRTALASADQDPFVLARLAEALDRVGERAASERAFQTGLQLDPQSEAVWLARGHIARRHGAWANAYSAYERAESAAPSSAAGALALAELLRERGHPERALAVLERMAARHPAQRPIAALARLELALARGDASSVTRAAGEALARRAVDVSLLHRSAEQLLSAQRPALAARLLAAVPQPRLDAALALQTALALGRHHDAELLLTAHAASAFGGSPVVADAYLRIDQPLRALEELDRTPDDDDARRSLIRGLAQLALGKLGEGALLLSRVPRHSSQRARAQRGLREALEAGGLRALAEEIAARP